MSKPKPENVSQTLPLAPAESRSPDEPPPTLADSDVPLAARKVVDPTFVEPAEPQDATQPGPSTRILPGPDESDDGTLVTSARKDANGPAASPAQLAATMATVPPTQA